MTLIEEISKLKKLEYTSRQLLCDRQEYAEKMASTAPALLDALDFRHGDAKLLDTILLQNEIRIQEHRGSILTGAEQQCIRRLAGMACKMEAKLE